MVICAPSCWSLLRKLSTWPFAASEWVWGDSLSHWPYSVRPYSLIRSWLYFGAIESVMPLTAGPG